MFVLNFHGSVDNTSQLVTEEDVGEDLNEEQRMAHRYSVTSNPLHRLSAQMKEVITKERDIFISSHHHAPVTPSFLPAHSSELASLPTIIQYDDLLPEEDEAAS